MLFSTRLSRTGTAGLRRRILRDGFDIANRLPSGPSRASCRAIPESRRQSDELASDLLIRELTAQLRIAM